MLSRLRFPATRGMDDIGATAPEKVFRVLIRSVVSDLRSRSADAAAACLLGDGPTSETDRGKDLRSFEPVFSAMSCRALNV